MMTFFCLVFLFYFLCLNSSSIHVLIFLVFIEFMILFVFIFLCLSDYIFVSLVFILFGVCMGAYSISIYLSFVRSSNSSYLMSILNF